MVESYIQLEIQEGAHPALLGKRPTDPLLANGHFITPTIFTNVDNKMRIAQEEIFGPVLCVIKYDSLDEAIQQANDTFYGLAAGVWSMDIERAMNVANRLRAGIVWINDFHLINIASQKNRYTRCALLVYLFPYLAIGLYRKKIVTLAA